MKSKLLWILFLGVPLWSFMLYGAFDEGVVVGKGSVMEVESCSRDRGCLAKVMVENKVYYANILSGDVNMKECSLRKHTGASKLVHGDYSCVRN